MLLPQSHAFKTLHARLHSVPTQALLQLDALPRQAATSGPASSGDLQPMLELFRKRQVRSAQPSSTFLLDLPSTWRTARHIEADWCGAGRCVSCQRSRSAFRAGNAELRHVFCLYLV